MARDPEPWKWEARQGYYAWVNGSRRRLCHISEGKRAARRALDELQRQADAAKEERPRLVGELVVLRLRDLRARRDTGVVGQQAKADVERRLNGFAEMWGDLRADEIRPHHVDEWLATKAGWNRTTRHDGAGAVMSVMTWAEKKGLIARNPLARMDKPKRARRREVIPTPDEVARLLAVPKPPELQDLLVFIFGTGCRPKEARTLEARHIDRANGLAVLGKHKTAEKTDKARVIFLTDETTEVVARLAAARPEGPIFLNHRGRPWTHNALGLALRRLRKRYDLPESVVAYALRHVYATDALAKGESSANVAAMLGHADLRMLSTYSHVDERTEALKAAARRVASGRSANSQSPPSDPSPSPTSPPPPAGASEPAAGPDA